MTKALCNNPQAQARLTVKLLLKGSFRIAYLNPIDLDLINLESIIEHQVIKR